VNGVLIKMVIFDFVIFFSAVILYNLYTIVLFSLSFSNLFFAFLNMI